MRVLTPNLSLCNLAVDIDRSLTSRCEIAFDFFSDEAYLLVKSLIKFSVFGREVRETGDVVSKHKIDNRTSSVEISSQFVGVKGIRFNRWVKRILMFVFVICALQLIDSLCC